MCNYARHKRTIPSGRAGETAQGTGADAIQQPRHGKAVAESYPQGAHAGTKAGVTVSAGGNEERPSSGIQGCEDIRLSPHTRWFRLTFEQTQGRSRRQLRATTHITAESARRQPCETRTTHAAGNELPRCRPCICIALHQPRHQSAHSRHTRRSSQRQPWQHCRTQFLQFQQPQCLATGSRRTRQADRRHDK